MFDLESRVRFAGRPWLQGLAWAALAASVALFWLNKRPEAATQAGQLLGVVGYTAGNAFCAVGTMWWWKALRPWWPFATLGLALLHTLGAALS